MGDLNQGDIYKSNGEASAIKNLHDLLDDYSDNTNKVILNDSKKQKMIDEAKEAVNDQLNTSNINAGDTFSGDIYKSNGETSAINLNDLLEDYSEINDFMKDYSDNTNKVILNDSKKKKTIDKAKEAVNDRLNTSNINAGDTFSNDSTSLSNALKDMITNINNLKNDIRELDKIQHSIKQSWEGMDADVTMQAMDSQKEKMIDNISDIRDVHGKLNDANEDFKQEGRRRDNEAEAIWGWSGSNALSHSIDMMR